MTSAVSCTLWSSVYDYQKVECAFTYPVRTEYGMFVLCCMLVWCMQLCGRPWSVYEVVVVPCHACAVCDVKMLSTGVRW